MSEPRYERIAYPMRADLQAGHRDALERIANRGTWWSGAERVRIAEEARAARDCTLCRERKAALSPSSVEGGHDGPGTLDPAVVDTIHRIVTDPGRLTRSFYEEQISGDALDPERYVELVSVSAILNALDVFARAIGVDSAPLPDPAPGEPSRDRPASARVLEAWVPQIPSEEEARGEEGAGDWHDLYGERESVPQIGRALSLVPAEVELLQSFSALHYMHLDQVRDPNYTQEGRHLSRPQMELIAARVSAINECFY